MRGKRKVMPFLALAILFLLSLACGSSASPTAESALSTSTKLVEVMPTDTPVATIVPTETNVPTVAPSNTAGSTETPTVNSEIIIETAKIIDAPVQQVETALGSSTETFSLGIGAAEEIPDGGESRTYQVGKYTVWVTYDKNGIAKGLQIVDGLLDDGYSLDQWGIILTRIGVDFVGLPDIEAPAARRWTNANGYAIMIAAERIDGNVWTVRIYKIP